MSLSRVSSSRVSSRVFNLSPLLFSSQFRNFSSSSNSSNSSASKDFLSRFHPEKLRNASTEQLFHLSSPVLLGLTPVAFLLSPSILAFPIDLALGLVSPFHAHRGMINVIDDYVPKDKLCIAKWLMMFSTGVATLGLLKVNLCGPGISESVKSLWRENPKSEKK